MSKKKVGPSDFKAEVEKLKAAGKLPSLEEVLDTLAETRKKYAPKTLEAREEAPAASTCRPDRLDSA